MGDHATCSHFNGEESFPLAASSSTIAAIEAKSLKRVDDGEQSVSKRVDGLESGAAPGDLLDEPPSKDLKLLGVAFVPGGDLAI